ncbi:DUF6063 family protein [Saccharibacillus brassicae]|uniref:Non-ribosomal peptide synthetase module n=1 Tax=Saccharibacillus brassicae TaxID=2583377 RepID=A0A4Y6UPV4_SACBS|nr:DUF6063 family protein [Saccharibacillus brassicae]QDH19662.1 non-ribosomal peptide synthetase module [Saccharibacillus brassicae]
MQFDEQEVMKAFRIYMELAKSGRAEAEQTKLYENDDRIRGLVDRFAAESDCVVIAAGEQLMLIPLARLSPFHMSNDALKKNYLKAGALNADLYLLYVAVIVWIGAFYDSYQTAEPIRSFLSMDEWLNLMRDKMEGIKERGEEQLQQDSVDHAYRWSDIVKRWDAIDDIKEGAKRQSGQTNSRLSFLDSVRRFLLDQELALEVGVNELGLNEKTKIVVQRYFMETEYNRGILEFLYGYANQREEEDQNHASDF